MPNRVRVLTVPDADRAEQPARPQKIDVPVVLAPRLLARPDREARGRGFSIPAEGVLDRGVRLPLELQEVADREIIRLEPADEHVVILGRAGQVDVVIARYPFLAARAFQRP